MSPLDTSTPPHILTLLAQLHKVSLEQESKLVIGPKKFAAVADESAQATTQVVYDNPNFDNIMLDKFIALDEDKCHFVYQLILSTGATNIVEAGTSFGVSTIYLALAVAKNKARSGGAISGKVIATEKEEMKANKAREHWKICGPIVEDQIDLRVGDLLQTLKEDVPELDMLLLDIWSPLALPTLKLVQPRLKKGAVVLADNTKSGAVGYKDMLEYMNDPNSRFHTMTLPFEGGFEMCVYSP